MIAAALVLSLMSATPCADHADWTATLEDRPESGVQADRARLAEILARPGFGSRGDDPQLWTRLLAWIRDWLSSLFETRGMQRFASSTRVIVLVVAAAAFVFGAWRWLLRRRGAAPAAGVARSVPAERLPLDLPAVHLERARKRLAGAPREAIREGLLALLSSLERVRLAQPDRVKTNRELADELVRRGAPPAVADAARRLLGWYDAAFYSLDPVSGSDAARFLDDVGGLGRRLETGP